MNRTALRSCFLVFVSLALALLSPALRAQNATGMLEGRVTNPATGGVVERARITVEGTALEAFSDGDGYYRLAGVPAGSARVRVTFSGFPPAAAEIPIAAGQTITRNFELTPQGAAPAGQTVKLDEFVVSTSREMSGAALAINEQRYAPNMRTVLSTDEFGDIAEGNAAEFLKFLPGVNIDYAGGNARDVSLNGVPSDYVPVTLDGFGLASAVGGGAGGTSRAVGLDQVSINNLSRIEVSFSPTPDSPGNALAGTVNLVPRSSFERTRPSGNFSAYFMLRDDIKHWGRTPAPRHPTRKIHPGFDFSYIAPVSRKFGFTLSAGLNRQYSGEPQILNTWRGVQAVTNGGTFPHTTPDRPYLSAVAIRNSGKDTKRSSFGATIDYRLSRTDRLSFSFTYSTFEVLINHNLLTFDVGRVNPGDFSLAATRGAAGQGTLTLATTGADRSNWTVMPSLVWRHDGPLWKMDAGFAYSRASNRNRTGESGFFDTTTSRRTGVTIGFSDIFYLRPNTITVADAAGNALNPYALSNYVLTAATNNTRATDDYKRTLYGNARRDFFGVVPLSLRTGFDFRQSTRDQRFFVPQFTYVGRDGVASTTLTATSDDQALPFLDPSFSDRPPHYGFPKFQGVSSELAYGHYQANPTSFTTNANTSYRNLVTNSKVAEELISSVFVRGDLQFFQNRLKLVTGLRAEQTNISAEGPLTDPNRNIQRDAQGRPVLGANGRPLPLVPASDALGVSRLTFLERAAHSEKEYLRLFPSVNASWNVREDLILRAAYYTSIGRPDYNQYAGGVTLPDPENPQPGDQITLSNASIKPWSAQTFNARIEYYLSGVGQLTFGAFRRDFENFFSNAQPIGGTEGLLELYSLDPAVYGAYPIVTQFNLDSTVRMQGLNASYKQALTFLPHWARGVQVFGNFSVQRLLGPAGTSNFPGFIPRTASWGASLNRGRYSLRANWNYRGLQRRGTIASTATNGIEPGTFTWWSKRLYLDVNAEVFFYKRFAFYAAIRNIGSTPDDVKVYGPNTPAVARFRQRIDFGSLWSFGVKGTF
ncbi:MAG: carboxypeptidase regulatory-like domain-containing protein [Opitutaceae bacterium]|nr:carboxypeptidase regulatory-like domain-containing protein [Opitutaceae bacterium]